MINPENYFETFDYSSIIEEIFSENNIPSDDNHYNRHMQEVKKKIDEVKKNYKSKEYFKEMPVFDKDFSSYVIMGNTPFVEEEKREKFKLFLSKKFGAELNEKIREFIFPYKNEDKSTLDNCALVLLKFDSYEEAKMATTALNGFDIDKSHKASVVTYMDYERIISMNDEYVPSEYFSFLQLINWEESNLTEMIMMKCANRILIGRIHYLKKEFQPVQVIPISTGKPIDVKWSPQGRYLLINEENSLKAYGGAKLDLKLSVDHYIRQYAISNNENYLITFSGYSSQVTAIDSKESQLQSKEVNKENVFIWDYLKNDMIRGLYINKDEKFENFKWSIDSKYFGRIKKDVLIIYEAPKMQMIPDSQGLRQPIKDNIKEFHWFPNRNNILTITEKRTGNRLDETIIQFFEIPSRKTFPASPITNLEVVSLEWHKNNVILAVLCKSCDKSPKWSIKIFEFDNERKSLRSAHTNLSSGDISYYSVVIKWIGNDLFVAPKFKENNLDTLNVCPFKLDKKTLKIEPWSADKFIRNMKHSHFLPSTNGVHFILACLDSNNTNSYGKVDLYAIFDASINWCRSFEFTNNLENVKWDKSGRLFLVELTRRSNEGVKFYDCEGNLLHDNKDTTIQTLHWRPRHFPILDKISEEDDIKKNFNSINKLYEEEDSQFLSAIEQVKRAERKKIRETFMSTINRRRQTWQELKPERERLVEVKEDVIVEHEFIIEEIIHTHEELVNADF